jgi:hypothetical protein
MTQHPADAMYAKLQAEIRAEKRLLTGWRRRHPHAGPDEREELARWAAMAKASIENLTQRLNNPAKQAA